MAKARIREGGYAGFSFRELLTALRKRTGAMRRRQTPAAFILSPIFNLQKPSKSGQRKPAQITGSTRIFSDLMLGWQFSGRVRSAETATASVRRRV